MADLKVCTTTDSYNRNELRGRAKIAPGGVHRPHDPFRHIVGLLRDDAREADAKLAFAGLIHIERFAANERDRLGTRVRLHVRGFDAAAEPAPEIEPAVGDRPLQLAPRAVALQRAD